MRAVSCVTLLSLLALSASVAGQDVAEENLPALEDFDVYDDYDYANGEGEESYDYYDALEYGDGYAEDFEPEGEMMFMAGDSMEMMPLGDFLSRTAFEPMADFLDRQMSMLDEVFGPAPMMAPVMRLLFVEPEEMDDLEYAYDNEADTQHCLHAVQQARFVPAMEDIMQMEQEVVRSGVTEEGDLWESSQGTTADGVSWFRLSLSSPETMPMIMPMPMPMEGLSFMGLPEEAGGDSYWDEPLDDATGFHARHAMCIGAAAGLSAALVTLLALCACRRKAREAEAAPAGTDVASYPYSAEVAKPLLQAQPQVSSVVVATEQLHLQGKYVDIAYVPLKDEQ